ncbi:hypothetical protein [Fundidesulfovibrio terrae]|uniref:hypothetical protein n=1 Tax=Fundidesulfovibrio terrae TaxID=2922866 RepID=UPI001FAEF778|nr:hypothetical protein [Fundidesulfovibrio terrae]
MFKRTACPIMVGLLALSFSGAAFAKKGSTSYNIDQREADQELRIQQGVKSGQLTPKEASKLEKGEARIQSREARMKSDGRLTPNERKQLNHQLDVESKKIYREKHDKQKVQ